MSKSKNGGHGGRRKGAGRKKGSYSPKRIAQEQSLNHLRNRILDKWDLLIDTKLKLALGEIMVVEDGVVYTKAPSNQALNQLFEFVVGKAPQKVEFEAPDVSDSVNNLADEIRKILDMKPTKQKYEDVEVVTTKESPTREIERPTPTQQTAAEEIKSLLEQ